MESKLIALLLVSIANIAKIAFANDSISALELGGIELQTTDEIAMRSEVLKITPKRVEVDYVFENLTSKEIKALIAFPLPPATFCGSQTSSYVQDGPDFVDEMRTHVDGKPVVLERHVRALLDGKDVTEKVKSLGFMDVPTGSIEGFAKKINVFVMREAASPSGYAKLVGTGLFDDNFLKMILKDKASDELRGCMAAKWEFQATYTRHQTFPPKAKVRVSHRYRPLVGGNSILEPNCSTYLSEVHKRFFQFKSPLESGSNADKLNETQVFYSLKPGANWAGPIGSFKLIVNGGHMTMVKLENKATVSFGNFFIEKKDFKPTSDLVIDFFSHQQNADKLVSLSNAPVEIDGPANLRTTPGGAQFMSIADGVKIKVLDVQGEWIKVQIGEKTGWTHSKNLRPIPDKSNCND